VNNVLAYLRQDRRIRDHRRALHHLGAQLRFARAVADRPDPSEPTTTLPARRSARTGAAFSSQKVSCGANLFMSFAAKSSACSARPSGSRIRRVRSTRRRHAQHGYDRRIKRRQSNRGVAPAHAQAAVEQLRKSGFKIEYRPADILPAITLRLSPRNSVLFSFCLHSTITSLPIPGEDRSVARRLLAVSDDGRATGRCGGASGIHRGRRRQTGSGSGAALRPYFGSIPDFGRSKPA